MTIRRLHVHDITTLIEIFNKELPQSFMVSLGSRFLELSFKSTLDSRVCFTLVAQEFGQAVGFALGCLGQKSFFLKILQENPFRVFWILLIRVLKEPKILFEILNLSNYSSKTALAPELLLLAVTENFQGKGVGYKLLEGAKKEFRNLGVKVFKVGAQEEMAAAKRFYQKTGGQFLENILLPNRKLIYYFYETDL